MPVIQLPGVVTELLLAVAWSALGVLLAALIWGVRERVITSTVGVAALHGVITWILAAVLEGPSGVSPWIPLFASFAVMLVLVEIFFEAGWVRALGISLVALAIADWPLVRDLWRAIPG